jgi:hypothetical protein
MFAGLPGIGVGTLFYVLMAFWMPVRELPRVIQGTSSLATWKIIVRQIFYAVSIIVTVMFAERVLLAVLGVSSVKPFSPATWLHSELGTHATGSILAAPIMASVLLLATVLIFVELLRVVTASLAGRERKPQPELGPTLQESALESSTTR